MRKLDRRTAVINICEKLGVSIFSISDLLPITLYSYRRYLIFSSFSFTFRFVIEVKKVWSGTSKIMYSK